MGGDRLADEAERLSCLDYVPVGVFVIDREYRVLFWNRCLEAWTGIPPGELVGRNLKERFPHFSMLKYATRLRPIFEGSPPLVLSAQLHRFVIPVLLPDGTPRLQHTTVTALRSLNGAGFHALFSIQDVTDLQRHLDEEEAIRSQAASEAAERRRVESTLKEREQFFQKVLDAVPNGIFFMDGDGIYRGCNKTFEEHLGMKREDLIGKSTYDIFPRELAEKHHEEDIALFQQLGEMNYESSLQNPGGGRPFMVRKSIFTDNSGVVAGLVGVTTDISENKMIERLLKQERIFSNNLFDAAPSGLVLINSKGRIERVNDAALQITGARREELLGKECRHLICPAEGALCPVESLRGEVERSEGVIPNKAGEHVPVIRAATRMDRGEETYFLESFIDISERKHVEDLLAESEKRFREMSVMDDLTGLYNLRHFYRETARETAMADRYGQPLSLMLFDVDSFRAYHDKYGHKEGDKALSTLACAIRSCLRQTDSAFRYGGAEFSILLPRTEGEKALVSAERLRTALASTSLSQDLNEAGSAFLTVSIGVTEYHRKEGVTEFVQRAEKAMCAARESGGNTTMFLLYERSSK